MDTATVVCTGALGTSARKVFSKLPDLISGTYYCNVVVFIAAALRRLADDDNNNNNITRRIFTSSGRAIYYDDEVMAVAVYCNAYTCINSAPSAQSIAARIKRFSPPPNDVGNIRRGMRLMNSPRTVVVVVVVQLSRARPALENGVLADPFSRSLYAAGRFPFGFSPSRRTILITVRYRRFSNDRPRFAFGSRESFLVVTLPRLPPPFLRRRSRCTRLHCDGDDNSRRCSVYNIVKRSNTSNAG